MATLQGIGAALSNALGGALIQEWRFHASFAGLAAIGALAAALLWRCVPETRDKGRLEPELQEEQAGPTRDL